MQYGALASLLLTAGCGDNDGARDASADTGLDTATVDTGSIDADSDAGGDTRRDAAGCAEALTVTFTTTDGVDLEGFVRLGGEGSPTIVLVHMIPPFNDRSNWPSSFQDELQARGWTVLNLDRRGAGGSSGNPEESYQGPGGALDISAAVGFLATHPCGLDMNRLAILSASNGTTSAFDYTVAAASDERPDPVAMAWLSGGGYTENQHNVADERTLLDGLRLFISWGSSDGPSASWSMPLQTSAPSTWVFDEHPSAAHGSAILTAHAESVPAITSFLATAFGE